MQGAPVRWRFHISAFTSRPDIPVVIRAISSISCELMKRDITIGSRVRMSSLGAKRCPSLAGKIGTVVGGSVYNNSFSIRFDGNKSSTTLHHNYLEVIAPYDRGPDSNSSPWDGNQDAD